MRLRFDDAETESGAAAPGRGRLPVEGAADHQHWAVLFGEAPPVPPSDPVEAVLRYHTVPPALVARMLAASGRSADPARRLGRGLAAALDFAALPKPADTRLMLIGPPAAGKTTLMAKLAARGRAPAVVYTTDGDRPGALAQLADPMSVLGIDALRLDAGAERLLEHDDADGPLLIDTGGIDAERGFETLGRLARNLAAEPLLVLPATIDADQARLFARAAGAIGATKFLITRLDLARRLGGALAAAEAGLAIAGGGVTPHFAFGLKLLSAAALARHLVTLARRGGVG